jgi:DNA-binding CsgD family transcriptional regulator
MPADRPAKPSQPLTKRQEDVLALLGEGITLRKTADILGISWATTAAHAATLRRKFAVKTSRELIPAAFRYFDRGPMVPKLQRPPILNQLLQSAEMGDQDDLEHQDRPQQQIG